MATYTPHHLVHAHLPSPPTHPDAFPELHIPTDDSSHVPQDSYSEPLHPDHAVSVVQEAAYNILARNIFNGYVLELRPLGLAINKTRQRSSEGSEIIRVFFPEPLRPLASGLIRVSRKHRRLYVVVVSQANIVYRLNFPLGDFQPGTNDRYVFAAHDDGWCEDWEVPEDVIVSCGGVGATIVLDEDTVVLGGGDGGIVLLKRSGAYLPEFGSWEATHHRGSSKFRLPSLFARSANSNEQIISFAEYQKEQHIHVLYTLSRDRKLRAWNVDTGACLKTIDVRSSFRALVPRGSETSSTVGAEDGSVNMIRIVPHPSPTSRYSHLVVTFCSIPHSNSSAGSFVVYRASTSSHGLSDFALADEKACSISAGSELRGFEILPPVKAQGVDTAWRLWAVWAKDGSTASETISMDDVFQFTTYIETNDPPILSDWQLVTSPLDAEEFDAAYFDNILGLAPPNPAEPEDNGDIPATFIEHLFHPGRFSSLTLQTALEDYIYQHSRKGGRELSQLVAPFSSLAKRFGAIVGHQLEIAVNHETGAPVIDIYRKELKRDWLGVWSTVRELDRQSRWPVTTCTFGQAVYVLTREGITSAIPEDTAGVVTRLGNSDIDANGFVALDDGALKRVYPALGSPANRVDAITISMVGKHIADLLRNQETDDEEGEGATSGSVLDLFLRQVDETFKGGWQAPPELVAGGLWDDFFEGTVTEQEREELRRILSETDSVPRALKRSIEILESASFPVKSGQYDQSSAFSGLGNALLSSAFTQLVHSRHILAQNVLLASLFHLSDAPVSGDDDESEEFISILARAMVAYHRYSVLKWVVSQSGEEAGERSQAARAKKANKSKRKFGKDVLAERLGGLKMKEGDGSVDSDGFTVEYSLVHSLLARQISQKVPEGTGSLNVLLQAAMGLLEQVGLLGHDQVDFAARFPDVVLGNAIFTDGHSLLAGAYTDLYPLSAGISYIKGRAYLEAGVVEGAVQFLEKAAAGVKDRSLAVILPSAAGPNGLGAYYADVSNVFKSHGEQEAVVRFGQMAIENAEEGHDTKDLWSRVFMANLELGQYEDAYTTLATLPFLDIKRDFIGHLISEMCENNEVGRLNAFGFIGFRKEVEELLRLKAKNSDPLKMPNYYQVLYSWHITRGDYRNAGEIMYLQGRRFAEGSSRYPAFELSARQARSYLAAINALALVDKENAWVSVPGGPSKTLRGVKRRKVTSYIPEDQFSKDKGPVDIITLGEIQMEYTVVLSQLQLSNQIPDLHEHGVVVSPQEVVGLFVQRGMYDAAQSAAASLQVDMTDLFKSLATRCVELCRLQEHATDVSAAAFLQTSPITSRLQGPPGSLALHYLRIALQRHDSSKTNYRYSETAADTLFEMNSDKTQGWTMPAWLVQSEMERNPEGWIGRALKWGWVEEALEWTLEMITKTTPPELLSSKKSDAVHIPYNLIDRVLAATDEGAEKDDKAVQHGVKVLTDVVLKRVRALETLRA